MVSRGPFVLEVPGRTFRFELHDYGGPYVLGKHGHPLADQPGARSLFWEAYWHWDRQGQARRRSRVLHLQVGDCAGTDHQASQPPATPTTPRARSKPTAKVTIRSMAHDAEIFSDGKFVGNAPAVLILPVGTHQFRALLKGYREWSRELDLIPDSDLTLAAKLVK